MPGTGSVYRTVEDNQPLDGYTDDQLRHALDFYPAGQENSIQILKDELTTRRARAVDVIADDFTGQLEPVNAELSALISRGSRTPLQTGTEQFVSDAALSPLYAGLDLALQRRFAPQFIQEELNNTSRFAPQFQEILAGLVSSERDSDIADVARLAPSLQGIRESGERSDVTDMRNILGQRLLSELGLGGELTDQQSADANDSIRRGQAARGISAGQGSANRESVKRVLEGFRLQREREGAAQNFMNTEAAQGPDPFSIILNRGATTAPASVAQVAQAQAPVAQALPRANTSATNLFGTNVQAALQAAGLFAANIGQEASLQTQLSNPNNKFTVT